MGWELSLPAVILLITACIAVTVAWISWQRRTILEARTLFWLMAAITIWSLTAAIESGAIALDTKIFWSKVEYLGATYAPPLFLLFCLEFTHHTENLSRLRQYLLWGIPAAITLLAATNEWHHLIWTGFSPSSIPGSNLYIYHHGPAFWIFMIFTYLCVGMATWVIIKTYFSSSHLYHKQLGVILIGSFLPWLGSLLYISGLNPVPGLDLTPISFAFTGAIVSGGFYYYRLLDLMPIARDTVIENLQDGVLVLDMQNRILDANPAALQIFDLPATPIGESIVVALSRWPALVGILLQQPQSPVELLMDEATFRYIDLRLMPIIGHSGEPTGYLATIHDVTERKQIEAALEAKTRELQILATTDDLTGLSNRRFANQALKFEIRRAKQFQTPLSVFFFDVDNFKHINDTAGHDCGDKVLHHIAEEIRRNIRASDTAARMGGDEFLLIFPDTDLNKAKLVVERLQNALNNQRLDCANISLTISGGATHMVRGDTPDSIFKRIDQLLNQAKDQGKNRILQDN
jgi:diguanylate cyclase (GGDEF)-like protein